MHVERTHEDTDGELALVQVLSDYIRETGGNPLLDIDHFLMGLYPADVDYGAVRGADDVLPRGCDPGRIPKKPDVTPEKNTGGQDQRRG